MKQILSVLLLALPFSVSAAAAEPVDVAIVLAVDVSDSITPSEYLQQKQGIVTALRDPEVARMLEQCSGNGLALTFVEWAGFHLKKRTRQEIEWQKLHSAADLQDFASRIERKHQRATDGFTDISNALRFSAELLARVPYEARRKIISVSSDGGQNVSPPGGDRNLSLDEMNEVLRAERDQIVSQGIVIDALVIANEDTEVEKFGPLDQYFSKNVIGGRGATITTISDYMDYAAGLKANLLAELNNCIF